MFRDLLLLLVCYLTFACSKPKNYYPINISLINQYEAAVYPEDISEAIIRCEALTALFIPVLKVHPKADGAVLKTAQSRLRHEARVRNFVFKLAESNLPHSDWDDSFKKSVLTEIDINLNNSFNLYTKEFETLTDEMLLLVKGGDKLRPKEQKLFQKDLEFCGAMSNANDYLASKSVDNLFYEFISKLDRKN
jgi:hypothetical protein